MRQSTKQLEGWRVLLVDNDENTIDILESLLHFFGASTSSTINGEEGLQTAIQDQPDFIITDISMPVMDGWQMVEALKANAATKSIPVIALTAHAMSGDREKAFTVGCEGYILKPLQPSKLLDELLAILVQVPHLSSRFGKV